MDYEVLYQEAQTLQKVWREKANLAAKLQKSIAKALDSGDLKAAKRDLAASQAVNAEISQIEEELNQKVEAVDSHAYLEGGDFSAQLLSLCERYGVDVVGTFPNFEMFPYKVRIDLENQDLYLDRKKVSCVRPEFFVQTVKTSRDKLMKASFNASQFLNELAGAYDLALLKIGKKHDTDIYLSTLYKFLVPRSRARKD